MSKSKTVRVIATRLGFYRNNRRRPGSEFDYELAEGKELPTWVEEVRPGQKPVAAQTVQANDPPGAVKPATEDEAEAIREKLRAANVRFHPRLGLPRLKELLAKHEAESGGSDGGGESTPD